MSRRKTPESSREMADEQNGRGAVVDDDWDGTSKALTKAFKANPSMESYVKLRRENPAAEIEIAIIGGLDHFGYMEDELNRYGIEPILVLRAMDADQKAIAELSLVLMERMIEARALKRAGETQLVRRRRAIPSKLIDWIIAMSLDALSFYDDLQIPRDLIVLIRERIGGTSREYEKAAEARFNKGRAAVAAGSYKAQGGVPTYKLLGKVFGVAPSTVKRWFKPGEFARETDFWFKQFGREGNVFPQPKRGPLRRK